MTDEPTSGVEAVPTFDLWWESLDAGWLASGERKDIAMIAWHDAKRSALAAPAASPAKATSDFVDARTAFEAANRGLPMDWVDDLCSGYRDAHTQSRWLGWKACWKRVETLSYALDQMRGPLSTAALIARAERAEALATPSPAPAALSALATVSGERQD